LFTVTSALKIIIVLISINTSCEADYYIICCHSNSR